MLLDQVNKYLIVAQETYINACSSVLCWCCVDYNFMGMCYFIHRSGCLPWGIEQLWASWSKNIECL